MRHQGRVGKWLAAALSAAALTLVPGPAHADGSGEAARAYLNLHQCVYSSPSAADHFTTVVTPSVDGRFATGTAVSGTADFQPLCGAGDGNYTPNGQLGAVKALDLGAGRYLNLHQCVYYSASGTDHFTTVVPGGQVGFAAGTNVSGTADTKPSCGPGGAGYTLIPLLSGVKALDLSAGRYLNLHQCVYYPGAVTDHFTTVASPSGDGRFATGTKVSDAPDTRPSCASGDGNYALVPLLSGVKALSRP